MNLRRKQQTIRIKTNFELREERMPMPGEHHVLIAIEPHTHRPARVMCRQRRERSRRGGLRFLATEAATHARHLHHYFIRRKMQHMRNNLLNFRRMLRG